MIKIINYQNEITDKLYETYIADCYDDVRKILTRLPETIQIYFSDYGIIPEIGVGGYAYAKDIITLSIDSDFPKKQKIFENIRPIIFHESFHIFQNFTGESGPFLGIENAIYEGMATVFEREYCNMWQQYGDYRSTPEIKIKQWIEQLNNLSLEDFEKSYKDWKFYHPTFNERWILYKVGTWIIDKVIQKYNLTIIDLSTKTANEVLYLFNESIKD